ncbi:MULTISPECIES: response regulator [Oceanimonas]|uniref:Response regulator n=1 Tax=Oceanimonas smirnovii TaxID=264574 RepID=A0ABW7P4Z6_9GAMM|nr:response regulator [Oceanimonas smirnovii]
MKVLLLEDDELVASLIEAVLTGLAADIHVHHAATLTAARHIWQRQGADLVLCDWNLPDGYGLDLVRTIRQSSEHTPVIIVSASSDRDNVKRALHLGVIDFIAKPFDVSTLHQRLLPVFERINAAELSDSPSLPLLDYWLEQALGAKLQLPGELGAETITPLLNQPAPLTPTELAARWKNETALVTRLLQLANNISLKRSGNAISRPADAISILGVAMSLNCAMAMALNSARGLSHPVLKQQAALYQAHAEQVAAIARAMALSIELDGASCHAAGLLCRCGELALLRTLQDYLDQGGKIDDHKIEDILKRWGPRYGNRLKIQWQLPIPLRELIGAVHVPPTQTTRKALLVMHLAGLRVSSRLHGPEAERLLRRAGLNPDKWLNKA